MDEPTSGLDSSAARDVIGCVTRLAAETGMVVVCTIHQPSAQLLASFSRAMVLGKNGQVAYCGLTTELPLFLEAVGHPLPAGSNTAEFALDLVDCDPAAEASTLRDLTQQWPQHRRAPKHVPLRADEGTTSAARSTSLRASDGPVLGASWHQQLLVHLRRQSTLAVRDPTLFSVRLGVFLAANAMFALVYIDSRERIQGQVTNKAFLRLSSPPSSHPPGAPIREHPPFLQHNHT